MSKRNRKRATRLERLRRWAAGCGMSTEDAAAIVSGQRIGSLTESQLQALEDVMADDKAERAAEREMQRAQEEESWDYMASVDE